MLVSNKKDVIILYFFIALICSSCTFNSTDSFYRDYIEEDLYRIPLIKPYRLITLYGISENEGLTSSWTLRFVYGCEAGYKEFKHAVIASEVNVSKKIIYGHYDGEGKFPEQWFVVIPDKKIERGFKIESEWRTYLSQVGINNLKLYDVWPLFREFKSYRTLPWYNPARSIYP